MDLRSTAAALWILAAVLSLKALPDADGAPRPDCRDEARVEVFQGAARRRLPLLLCPEALDGRVGDAPRGAAALLLGRPIDLNAATFEELQALPGVGPGLARRIVEDREKRGPFRSPEALARVRGFGPGRVDALDGLVSASAER